MAEQDNSFMPCDECGVNEAAYTISVMMDGHQTQRHLCADCMAKMNMEIATGNVKNLLGAIMAAISAGVSAAQDAAAAGETNADDGLHDVVCEKCGTPLDAFVKEGRLGCAGCYETFRERLIPMLEQVHGRAVHTGRRPLDTEEARSYRSAHEELERQMELAAQREDFETAAMLRDQLRALEEEGAI